MLRVGRTWSHIRWSPPVNKGTLGTISSYSVTAEPRPFNGSKMPLNRSEDRSSRLSLLNSSCIESECETRSEHIPGSEVSVNLTSLIQGLEYSLTLTAFSHGSSLQSAPSDVISFNTLAHGEIRSDSEHKSELVGSIYMRMSLIIALASTMVPG